MRPIREYFQIILNTVAKAHILHLQRVKSQEIAPIQGWHSHLARLSVSDGSLNIIIFRKYLVLPCCFLGLLLYSPPSQAELHYSFLCQDVSKCTDLANKAHGLSQEKNLQEAQGIYQGLYQTWPDPNLAFDVARVLEKQDRFQDGIPFYLTCIHSPFCLPELQVLARNRLGIRYPIITRAARSQSITQVPLYKRWWLWTLFGTAIVAASVAASVTGGLVTYAQPPPDFSHSYRH